LAVALLVRWPHSGSEADLNEAIALLEDLRENGEDPGQQIRLENALGGALRYRHEAAGDPADLDRSIACLEAALTLADSRGEPPTLFAVGLGQALQVRHGEHRRDEDGRRAIALLSAAARTEDAPHGLRVQAARSWARMAADTGGPSDAIQPYAMLLQLLTQGGQRQLHREDQEHQVGRTTGVVGDAVACALDADAPSTALGFLEQGRGVLIADQLNRRYYVDAVRPHAPALADELSRITDELDRYSTDPREELGDAGGTFRRWTVDRRHRLMSERQDLIARIHRETPLDRFLLPPTAEELVQLAAEGPVVMPTVSERRCDAVILTPNGPDVLRLPALNRSEVEERTIAFLTAVGHASDHTEDPDVQAEAEVTVVTSLAWLWEALVEPVLNHLNLDGPAADAWPRLWWSPTGLLNFMPLHAAGRNEPGASALDRVVCSYTPTLRVLEEVRRPHDARTLGEPKMLMVAMPQTSGLQGLDGVDREILTLMKRFGSVTPLVGADATASAVLEHLPRHPWVHIASHGLTVMDQPSESHIVVHEGRVTVRDLAGLRTRDGELAFLAACDTVRGAPQLADEAIHLGAALQLAGYRHVVGTLWSAADDVAARVVHEVYGALRPDVTGAGLVPLALHAAVRGVRDQYPDVPSLWSGYAHFGP
jgi:hypothetical protein